MVVLRDGSSKEGAPTICLYLQDSGLQFGQAVWSARQLNTGFSIFSFVACARLKNLLFFNERRGGASGSRQERSLRRTTLARASAMYYWTD